MNELFTKPVGKLIANSVGNYDGLGKLLGIGSSAGSSSAGSGTSIWSAIGSWFSGLPSFDVGIGYVPRDMVAKVHEGERILTKDENRRGYGQGMSVNISQTFAPGTDLTTTNQAARDAALALRRASRFR